MVRRHILSQTSVRFHAVRKIFRITCFCDQLQVAHARANRNPQLVGIDDAGKWNVLFLAARGFCEKVFVLREQDTSQLCCSIEQNVVRCIAAAILLSRQNVHAAQPQTGRDGSVNVFIHVQRVAHDSSPCARNLAAKGEGPAFARTASAKRARRSMSASNSCL